MCPSPPGILKKITSESRLDLLRLYNVATDNPGCLTDSQESASLPPALAAPLTPAVLRERFLVSVLQYVCSVPSNEQKQSA